MKNGLCLYKYISYQGCIGSKVSDCSNSQRFGLPVPESIIARRVANVPKRT